MQVASTNGESIIHVTALVKEASGYKDELSAVLLGFKQSLDSVRSLKDEIQLFNTDVQGLSKSVLAWSEAQNDAASHLAKEVGRIAEPLEHGLDRWSNASDFFSDNHSVLKAGLEDVVKQLSHLHGNLHSDQERQVSALSQIFDGFEKKTASYWIQAMEQLSERFDHPSDVLREVRNLSATLEGAKDLGSSLPGLTESLSDGSQQFTQNISSLSGTVEQLARQQKSHQDALIQVSERLAQISEKLDKPRESEGLPEPSPSLSSRTVLGLPIGPPSWMTRLLEKVSREGKR